MKTVYLVRHASAEGQPIDAPLTEQGRKQALSLVDFFKHKDRLGERVLSTVSFEDWRDKLKQSFDDFDLVFEGGESHTAGMERAKALLEDVLCAQEENILLVSHGNMTTLLMRYFNESFGYDCLMEMTNPDVFEIVVSDEKAILKRIWDDRI